MFVSVLELCLVPLFAGITLGYVARELYVGHLERKKHRAELERELAVSRDLAKLEDDLITNYAKDYTAGVDLVMKVNPKLGRTFIN